MKYLIACLIHGDAETYQRKVMKGFSKKFNVADLNKHIPPHITLKSPFEASFFQIQSLKMKLNTLCKKLSKSSIQFGGIGNFGTNVIYLKAKFSESARKNQKEVITTLEKLKWISWREFDKLENFHATLTYCKSNIQFKKFIKYFSMFEKHFDIRLDNLGILKKNKSENWEVYKEFKLT